jgi:Domain of unknown function DUF29
MYTTDFNLWIAQTTQRLREKRWHEIDVEHLVDEVENLGKSDRRDIASQLTRLLYTSSNGNISPSAVQIVGSTDYRCSHPNRISHPRQPQSPKLSGRTTARELSKGASASGEADRFGNIGLSRSLSLRCGVGVG